MNGFYRSHLAELNCWPWSEGLQIWLPVPKACCPFLPPHDFQTPNLKPVIYPTQVYQGHSKTAPS